MWKRKVFSVLAAVLILAASGLGTVAHAAENDDSWIQVLEYTNVNGGYSNYFVVNNKSTIRLPLPQRMYCVWIDLLVNTSDNPITSAYSIYNGSKTQLTVTKIGDKLCRIYGRMSYHTYEELQLEINCSGTGYYELVSCRVSNLEQSSFPIRGKMEVQSNQKLTVEQTDPDSAAVGRINSNPDAHGYTSWWTAMAWSVDNWKAYDSISFTFRALALSITSISAKHEEMVIPVSVSPIVDTEGQVSGFGGMYSFQVTLDLSGLDRSSNMIPYVYITGEAEYSDAQYIALDRTTGYVETAISSPLTTWFNKLFAKLDSLFGDRADSDAFQEDAVGKKNELLDLNEQMAQVDKPDPERIPINPNDFIDPYEMQGAVRAFTVIVGESSFQSIILMSLTVALIAYVLYGKR